MKNNQISERDSFIEKSPDKLTLRDNAFGSVKSDHEDFISEAQESIQHNQTLNSDKITPNQSKRAKANWERLRKLARKAVRTKIFCERMRSMGKNIPTDGSSNDNAFLKQMTHFQTLFEENTPPKKKKKKMCNIPLLKPEHSFMLFWNLVIAFLMVYTATIMPYRVAFVDEDTEEWKMIENVIDFTFIADMLITFNLAFYNKNTNKLETNRKVIALSYLKTWFFIDLVASIPQNLIFSDSFLKETDLIRLARLPKLYRMVRIVRFLKVIKTLKNSAVIQDIQDFFNMNFGLYRLMTFLITTVLISHITGCLWYALPRIYDPNNFWVTNLHLQDEENMRLYLFSIYWAFATMFTLGYGDIHAFNVMEYIMSIVWMLFGVGFYSFTIGTLSSILVSVETREKVITSKMAILNTFAKETRLSKSLKEKIKKIISFNANKNFFSLIEKQDLFKNLPANLKNEVEY